MKHAFTPKIWLWISTYGSFWSSRVDRVDSSGAENLLKNWLRFFPSTPIMCRDIGVDLQRRSFASRSEHKMTPPFAETIVFYLLLLPFIWLPYPSRFERTKASQATWSEIYVPQDVVARALSLDCAHGYFCSLSYSCYLIGGFEIPHANETYFCDYHLYLMWYRTAPRNISSDLFFHTNSINTGGSVILSLAVFSCSVDRILATGFEC